MLKVKISSKWIGGQSPVFIIAEAGINHNGSLKIAKKMITKAKECGVDAIKFQTFKAKDLTSTKSKYFKIFKNSSEKYLGIVYDISGIIPIKQKIKQIGKKITIYVFSVDGGNREEEFNEIKDLVLELNPIPNVILKSHMKGYYDTHK